MQILARGDMTQTLISPDNRAIRGVVGKVGPVGMRELGRKTCLIAK